MAKITVDTQQGRIERAKVKRDAAKGSDGERAAVKAHKRAVRKSNRLASTHEMLTKKTGGKKEE